MKLVDSIAPFADKFDLFSKKCYNKGFSPMNVQYVVEFLVCMIFNPNLWLGVLIFGNDSFIIIVDNNFTKLQRFLMICVFSVLHRCAVIFWGTSHNGDGNFSKTKGKICLRPPTNCYGTMIAVLWTRGTLWPISIVSLIDDHVMIQTEIAEIPQKLSLIRFSIHMATRKTRLKF